MVASPSDSKVFGLPLTLIGIWLNDCNSILQRNIGVDLAVDERLLVQIFEPLQQGHVRFLNPPSERPNPSSSIANSWLVG
jgi:hypothetical protein